MAEKERLESLEKMLKQIHLVIQKYKSSNDLMVKQSEIRLETKVNQLMQGEVSKKIEVHADALDKKLVLFKSQSDQKVQKLNQEFATVLTSLKSGKYNKLAKGTSLTTGRSESEEMILRRIDGLANEVKMMKLQMIRDKESEAESKSRSDS